MLFLSGLDTIQLIRPNGEGYCEQFTMEPVSVKLICVIQS